MANVSTNIISALGSGLTFIGDLANGVKDAFMRFMTDGTIVEGVYTPSGISVMGIVLLTFGGISLAFGLCKLGLHLFRSKVGR